MGRQGEPAGAAEGAPGPGLRGALAALRDGGAHVDMALEVGFLRVGAATFHPAAAAVARAAEAAAARGPASKPAAANPEEEAVKPAASRGFWLCFGLDENLREACGEAGDEAAALQKLCEIALVEPVDTLPEDAAVVLVGNAGAVEPCGEAMTRDEALQRQDLELAREVLARQQVVLRNARPVGDMDAARKLAATLSDLVPGLEDPVVIVADRGALVSVWTDDHGDEDACTLLSSDMPASLRTDGQLTTQTLATVFSDDGKDVSRMEATATYELLGNVADATGCVALLARWAGSRASPCRLLGPPALIPEQALLLVRGTPLDAARLPEERASSIFLPDAGLIVLNRLQSMPTDEVVNLDLYEPDAAWARRVQTFFRSAVSGSLFSRARGARASGAEGDQPDELGVDADGLEDVNLDDSDLTGALEPGHRVLKARTNLDFTEHLWNAIIVRADALDDIMYALRELVRLLEQGKLLPYIHKSNKSMLGVICRHIVQRQAGETLGETPVAASGSTAQTFATFTKMFAQPQIQASVQAVVVKHLIKLGIFKLKRDFEGWFSEIGMDMPAVDVGGVDALQGLVRLRNALQTVATALAVQCPLMEAKQIAQVCLAHENARTLLVPLRSQLPWVKGGEAGLPTARSWQLEQQDKRGDMIQTARLTPLAHVDLPRLEAVLSRESAAKAVAMLDSEPDGIIRSMVSYPADGSTSSSTSTSQARSTSCICIQTRRLCLA